MSTKHPVMVVTGSSGAGTTSVTRSVQEIFRRQQITPALVEGDSFHRYDRDGMKAAIADAAAEGNPIAFIIEQAGGLASTGHGRLMEVTPQELHQRVPVIFGSRAEVELIERYHRDHAEPSTDDFSLFNTRSLFRA